MLGRDSESLVDHFRAVFGGHPEQEIFRFLVDGEGEPQGMANAALDLRARTIAAVLRERFAAGERALIMCPAGLDYVTSFFACLYAGLIAVPVYPPDPAFLMRTLPRLTGVIDDARPAVVLAPTETVALADQFIAHAPALRDIAWLAVDDLDSAAADAWRHPGSVRDDIAFLQYTSGSTSRPKGVMVSHGNLLHNISSMIRPLLHRRPRPAPGQLAAAVPRHGPHLRPAHPSPTAASRSPSCRRSPSSSARCAGCGRSRECRWHRERRPQLRLRPRRRRRSPRRSGAPST